MDGAQGRLSARDAGVKGGQIFREIMPEHAAQRVLLEGLEYDEEHDQWAVTIGFDTFRPTAVSSLDDYAAMVARSVFEPKPQEVVREYRTFHLNAVGGSLVRMVHG